MPVTGPGLVERDIAMAVESLRAYRDADMESPREVSLWRPRLMSADAAILRDAASIRSRARDLVRNNAYAKNAVRMNRDAVSGNGLKLALKIDWRSLGITDIEIAAEWQDHVTRAWESYAESSEFQADARRQRTFSELFALADSTDFVDGECLGIIEMKPGIGLYQTCVNLIDVDRLSNPAGVMDQAGIRGGIERDVYGEPIAYHIRDGHPADVGAGFGQFAWQRVPRQTLWGRPIVLHTYAHDRPEQTRGVSEFASALLPSKMLSEYADTELQSAIVQAGYAAVIKTELDWSSAMQVLGAQASRSGPTSGGNPYMDMVYAHMSNAADYAKQRDLTFNGSKIPHLMPNESLEVLRSTHPNSGFADFEKAFLRQLAAGLGVEAHELSKNYSDVNYSAARAALLAVWRTYRARRTRNINQFAMPVFSAWLEEAFALGAVQAPAGVVNDFVAIRPYICKGTFIAWGKPAIDPLKERQAQVIGLQNGLDTLESVLAEEGESWRDNLEQQAYEARYRTGLGLPDPRIPGVPSLLPMAPTDTGEAP